jgi:hypothetical protein
MGKFRNLRMEDGGWRIRISTSVEVWKCESMQVEEIKSLWKTPISSKGLIYPIQLFMVI